MQRTPPELTSNARALRLNATDAERRLWRELKVVRPRFTRHLVISHFIADFAGRSLRLIVELDGGQHDLNREADAARTAYLEANGWRVVRFWNTEVLGNPDGVMAVISAEMVACAATHPQPLPVREGS